MKAIKIGNFSYSFFDELNTATLELIDTELTIANGKASAHVYRTAAEIYKDFKIANRDRIPFGKQLMIGARLTLTSGENLPNAYTYQVHRTTVTIELKSTGWFITTIKSDKSYSNSIKRESWVYPESKKEDLINTLVQMKLKFYNEKTGHINY